ncbi:MAG TPA: hypothetical protein VMW64_10580 [Dehalococcoidia bacterium]|nr:hypothetical protein [Dehalococcoidia bacterium]
MKLDKAIELLNLDLQYHTQDQKPDLNDAIKLGIEALKQLQGLHKLPHGSPLPPLAGETPEDEPERSHDVTNPGED